MVHEFPKEHTDNSETVIWKCMYWWHFRHDKFICLCV